MSKVIEISEENFESEVLKSELPVFGLHGVDHVE